LVVLPLVLLLLMLLVPPPLGVLDLPLVLLLLRGGLLPYGIVLLLLLLLLLWMWCFLLTVLLLAFPCRYNNALFAIPVFGEWLLWWVVVATVDTESYD